MTSLDIQLWELIANHEMPEDGSGRAFIEQLTTEHSISHQTAATAIDEYRKFIYLCATRAERNVPSKAVDLVWHLHMQHSRDYWDVFCRKLGRPVHHSPGGAGPQQLDDYKGTVGAYRDLWATPPKGIWRESRAVDRIWGLVVSALFICIGFFALAHGAAPIPWLALAGFGVIGVLNELRYMTTHGELTLVFETGDPFADDDAGDCGSGDCGGCGD